MPPDDLQLRRTTVCMYLTGKTVMRTSKRLTECDDTRLQSRHVRIIRQNVYSITWGNTQEIFFQVQIFESSGNRSFLLFPQFVSLEKLA